MLMRTAHDTAFDGWRGIAQHGVQRTAAPVRLDRVKLNFRTILFADDAHEPILSGLYQAGNTKSGGTQIKSQIHKKCYRDAYTTESHIGAN
ncbi:MAG: hypothetical protein EXR28_04250 [Betaproteobacteria bacterium]|nr:hypothetical protein [Betaproteobacteria bacterium]